MPNFNRFQTILANGVLSRRRPAFAPADLMVEGFEATAGANIGFDTAGWNRQIGAGCTVDADAADLARPDGGSQFLKTASLTGLDAYAHFLFAGNKPAAYTTLYVRFDSSTPLVDGDLLDFVKYTDQSTWDKSFRLYLNKNAGALSLYATALYEGTEHTGGSTPTVSYDTWYKVQFYYDATNKKAGWKLNGVEQWATSWAGASTGGMGYITLQSSNINTRNWTVRFDGLKISSTGYTS